MPDAGADDEGEWGLSVCGDGWDLGQPPRKRSVVIYSAQQARNLDGWLSLRPGGMPSGPVLLVDDMVDSRWTLTVASWLLRSNGAAEVWPLALARAGGGSD